MLKAIGPIRRFLSRPSAAMRAAMVVGTLAVVGTPVVAAAAPQSAIVVDGKTGKVLYSSDPDGLRHPASLTKMMTLYLLFDALDRGQISMSSRLKVSTFASRQSPTKLGLRPGSTIAVRDAMLGLITRSANDAAVVIAENLAGSEAAFANKMTKTARSLGMTRTTFRNASGLPNPNQWTTARDMATLGRALQARYPSYYRYFATKTFVYNGRSIGNHNKLLGRVEGVDGIKTGYTRASGFNLVSSVKRNNRYIVATVMGGSSGASRDRQMVGLIDKYMSSASTGGGNSFIAKILPKPRPDVQEVDDAPVVAEVQQDTIETASLVPAPRSRPGPQARAVQTQDIAPSNDMAEISYAETPAANDGPRMVFNQGPSGKPVAQPVAMAASAAGTGAAAANPADNEGVAEGDVDDPAPTPLPKVTVTGWKVQIAAVDTEDGARTLLEQARAKGGRMLASADLAIETVAKGGDTFYRARFVGFGGKTEARAACAYLKKHDVNCLAISD